MTKAVFDTNVYISATLFGGIPKKLILLAFEGKFQLFTSGDILTEISGVLAKKFNYSQKRISQVLDAIGNIARTVKPSKTVDVVKSWPSDNRILECAVTAKANYLVTGDKKHLLPLKKYQSIQIVSPEEFLKIIDK